MSRLILFIYLHEDESNPIEGLMRYIEKEDQRIRFECDAVVRLAQNTFVFDETTAHGLLVLLCSEAQKRGRAYLLVPVQSDVSLLAGTPPKEVQSILERFQVPFCPPLKQTS